MSTFLLMLRLAFWINPLQRALICIGIVCVVVSSIAALSDFPKPQVVHQGVPPIAPLLEGLIISTVAALLMGGVYWRIASAPRIVRLAPHGRTRLLCGALGSVLLVGMLCAVEFWLFYLHWADLKPHVPLTAYLAGMANAALLPSAAAVGLFVASRSPLAALAVLILLVSPGAASTLFDVNLLRYMNPGPRALMLLALIWIPFAIWYLRARRINPPGWLAGGGRDVLATNMVSWVQPQSRRVALERQLLGGITIMRFGLQWFVVLGLLLGLQWLVVRFGGSSEPEVVAHVMYASLCICPVVTTVASFAAIRRSRALWLLTATNRAEFFICVERILARLNIAMAVAFAIWFAALSFMQLLTADKAADQLVLVAFQYLCMWWLGWMAINTQLAGWPKWTVAFVAAGVLIGVWWFSAVYKTTPRAEVVAGMATTVLMIGGGVAMLALRWIAQRRWREGDFPRAVTSAASGT